MLSEKTRISSFGWTSLVLSIAMWVFIFKGLFYWMPSFSEFEAVSSPVSVVPIIVGIIGLLRKERPFVPSIVGICIAVLTFIWLFVMKHINGM